MRSLSGAAVKVVMERHLEGEAQNDLTGSLATGISGVDISKTGNRVAVRIIGLCVFNILSTASEAR